MYIEIKDNGALEKQQIIISHKGIKTLWDTTLFDKTSFKTNNEIFVELNQYWSIIPDNIADGIFEVYKAIKDSIEKTNNLEKLILELRVLVAELMDVYHAEAEIEKFVEYYSKIRIPDSVKDAMIFEAGSQTTSEKTYLTTDYQKLAMMVIRLRAMVPVWADFVYKIRKEVGPQYKEMAAFQLLDKSSIMTCEAMEKLILFIERQGGQDIADAAIVYCVSSDDYKKWFIANIVIRRLSIGDIRQTDDKSNLIKNIHQYIRRKNNTPKNNNGFNNGGKFDSTVIRLEPISGDDDNSDNNLSVLEGQRSIEETTVGDTAAIDYYVEDPYRVAKKIDPTISDQLIKDSLENTATLINSKLSDAQLYIVKYVLNAVIPPRAFINETAQTAIRSIAVTQALLWHWGFYELAAIVSAMKESNAEDFNITIKPWSRLTPELNIELARLFPFKKRASNHQNSKMESMPLDAMEEICSELRENTWALTLKGDYLKKIMEDVHSTKYTVPFNIRIIFANFVIFIVKRGNE